VTLAMSDLNIGPMENPFRGLRPFGPKEPLFERDNDVNRLMGLFWSNKVTVLFAPSGVGKSSFLNAKLVPALEKAFGEKTIIISANWTKDQPRHNLEGILAQIHAARKSEIDNASSIVILDQFEELFQYFPNEALLKEIGGALKKLSGRDMDTRILVVIREEFLADLSMFDSYLPGLLSNYYRLEKFNVTRARTIIEKTVQLGGGAIFYDGLNKLLDDLVLTRAEPNADSSSNEDNIDDKTEVDDRDVNTEKLAVALAADDEDIREGQQFDARVSCDETLENPSVDEQELHSEAKTNTDSDN
jgi:hypothetical protein